MKRITLLITLLGIMLSLSAVVTETASLKAFLYGTAPQCQYDNWISHVSEGIAIVNYNLYAPYDRQSNDFGEYVTPTAAELTNWESALNAFISGNLDVAQQIINNNLFPYTVVIFNDTDTNRQFYMLRENLNLSYTDNNDTPDYPDDDEIGSFSKGWGLYIMYPESNNPIIVDVVHPNDDFLTPALAHKAFIDWQAKYLLIAGAGREVKWTNEVPYTNSKSLSDASRVSAHPFNSAYRKFADNIRAQFNRREFAAQIHSYDWNRHEGYASLQISVGNPKVNPNLPTRDLSDLKLDCINATDYIVFPQNSLGVHDEVTLNDYYAVNYQIDPFTYNLNGQMIPVNNNIDLPGFAQNIQQNYTLSGTSDYDVFDPFFHVEFDELPNCYPQTNNNYYWFYGFNALEGVYDRNHLFDNSIAYYGKWVDAMTAALPATITLNDQLSPATPQNLTKVSEAQTYIRLAWDPISCFDFKSYEILYSTQPINETNFLVFNRNNNELLASPTCKAINVTGLTPGLDYYFKIRAVDYNNNISNLSNEVQAFSGSAIIDNISCLGNNNQLILKWRAVSQTGNQGFKILKSSDNVNFTQIADWNTNPSLLGSTQSYYNYSYIDNDVINYNVYYYKIVPVNNNNIEFPHYVIPQGQPQPVYTLYFKNNLSIVVDSIKFSKNLFATDGEDNEFDVTKSTSVTGSYVWGGFYEQYWSTYGDYLSRETYNDFDVNQNYKIYSIRVKSNITAQNLFISVSDDFNRNSEKLYLRNISTGTYTDLSQGDASFTVANTSYKDFYLYWGNLNPVVTIPNAANSIIAGGTTKSFSFSTSFNFLAQSHTVYLKNETDSLIVQHNLAGNATSAAFQAPDDLTMHNAKLFIKTTSTDGEIRITESSYTVGIVPAMTSYVIPEGLFMMSNPFNSNVLTQAELSDNLLISKYENQAFAATTTMNYNQGYFLNAGAEINHNYTYSYQTTNETQVMNPKWNLVANPHIAPYNIKNLEFYLNNTLYTFAELVQQKVIAPVVYVCRENKYIHTEIINPYESFFIYANITELSNLSCYFIPYNNVGIEFTTNVVNWTAKIIAHQIDTDEIIIGATDAKSDSIDFKYEMPEPPFKPIPSLISMYFNVDPTDNVYEYSKLNSFFKTPLNNTVEEFKDWDFSMNVNSLDPITFTADRSAFPTNYSLRMVLDNQEHILSVNNNSFVYTPLSTGTINGIIRVGNQFVNNADNVYKPNVFSAYPNPFNPETNLSLSLAKAANVEINIYNIKGQKVKKIVNEKLNSGNHNFTWNGTDQYGKKCASNIYIAMVKVNGKNQSVKKLTLLK